MKNLKDEFKDIASKIKTKSSKEVKAYSKEFYEKAGNINEMKKEYKKVMLAQERIAREKRNLEVLRWKRKQYDEEHGLLPLSNWIQRNSDLTIARFMLESKDMWEDTE